MKVHHWKTVLINITVSIMVGAAPFVLFEENQPAQISQTMLAAIFVVITLALFYILSIHRKLRQIRESIHQFEQGNFEKRLEVADDTQLSGIAFSFNNMADRIVTSIVQLKENERMRTELVTNVSHDLRSPLTSIRGYVETAMLNDKQLTSENRRKLLDVVLRNTNLLIQLIDELFELSRLEEKQKLDVNTPFSIAKLTECIALRFGPTAKNNEIQLTAHVPDNIHKVQGNQQLIERALSNIVQNAITYTPKGGRISIALDSTEKSVAVTVSDTGIGIPDSAIPHIVERFYRVDKDRSRTTGGTGLGLAIAKQILDAHKSQLEISSKVGLGTSICFSLRKAEHCITKSNQ